MSPSPEPQRRRANQAAEDQGFTLIEVIVALGLVMTLMVAVLPQLIIGLRSNDLARLVTQAKGVTQGQVELMRNLPFHIAPAAGDYIDVLDRYYRDLTPPGTTPVCTTASGEHATPATTWNGYVGPTSTRCGYEPQTGAFYRHVAPPSTGPESFWVVTNTQFLDNATPPQPVTPPTGYSTQTVGKDSPPASQVGVTVTVLYDARGTLHPVSTYTQIAGATPTPVRAQGQVTAAALDLGSTTGEGLPLTLAAGLLTLSSSLSHASTASVNLAATSAGLGTGDRASGASYSGTAPPTVDHVASTAFPGMLSGDCLLACWGTTALSAVQASAGNGLPNAGSSTAPLQALLQDKDPAGRVLSFGTTAVAGYRGGLGFGNPLVRVDDDSPLGAATTACGPASGGYLGAAGYLRTTAEDATVEPRTVETCGAVRSATVDLFPTDLAPGGLVKLTLTAAHARCRVTGTAHTPTATYDYDVTVKFKVRSEDDDDGETDGYRKVRVTPSATTDLLAAVPLTTPVGGGRTLGDYIESWSSITPDRVVTTAAGGTAQVNVPGVVNIVTKPVRPGTGPGATDPTSTVSLSLGAVGCLAQDAR